MVVNYSSDRYNLMKYNRCGNSGLLLPAISLGLWHNFGDPNTHGIIKEIITAAFDSGITHFDLANNYGPPPGAAEINFGKILKNDLSGYRDEIIVSTKAGYRMWPGPYGEWGSKKYFIASLDQSLKRLGLEYVDIFYSHRFDPDTPLAETMEALNHVQQQGKAIYVGVSNYDSHQTREAVRILGEMGSRCVINQPSYSMLNRWIEKDGLIGLLEEEGIGCVVYSPLQQGLLTNKYFEGIPPDSRASKEDGYNEFRPTHITKEIVEKARKLNNIAQRREQTLAQMALAWALKDFRITSAIVGARTVTQLQENLESLKNLEFFRDELSEIDDILNNC